MAPLLARAYDSTSSYSSFIHRCGPHRLYDHDICITPCTYRFFTISVLVSSLCQFYLFSIYICAAAEQVRTQRAFSNAILPPRQNVTYQQLKAACCSRSRERLDWGHTVSTQVGKTDDTLAVRTVSRGPLSLIILESLRFFDEGWSPAQPSTQRFHLLCQRLLSSFGATMHIRFARSVPNSYSQCS